MHEYISKMIEVNYKTYGLYKINILKSDSINNNLYSFVDIKYSKEGRSPHGYIKRKFFDYLSKKEIGDYLYYYLYDTKRDMVDIKDVMNEDGIFISGTIELNKIKKDNHITIRCPLFLTPKSKLSKSFKEYIIDKSKTQSINSIYKELTQIKGFNISKSSLYNIVKNN